MPLKILVAEDVAANLALVEAVARGMGHSVVTARNGGEAVRKYLEEAPDLVFMDIMMPEMDGLTAVREIRALPAERWVPIVYLTAFEGVETMIQGLEAGGDDYLTKPVDIRLLRAKIEGYARALALQRELFAYTEELERRQSRQQEENDLARHVMDRLAHGLARPEPLLQAYNRPADHFSGDLLLSARTPSDVLHVLLADATGHGLAAALSAMPVPQIFHGMTAKGFGLPAIAAELNRRLKQLMPPDRFVAATLVAIDIRTGRIEVWNGGNPDVLYADPEGKLQRWPSRHPPLGILPPEAFSDATESLRVAPGGSLFLCSDGLLEIEGGGPIQQTVEAILARNPASVRYLKLQEWLNSLLAEGGRAQDDITLALVHVPRERRRQARLVPTPAPSGPVHEWSAQLSYGGAMLRKLDVVPMVMNIMSQLEALAPHQGALFLILSELFNNALDHGLLGLDSTLKEGPGGFDRYMEERKRRLETLQTGLIEVGMHMHMQGGRPVLDITVRDSGPGFDYEDYVSPFLDENRRPHGRGIALVRSLCQEVVYSGCGNSVLARYALGG